MHLKDETLSVAIRCTRLASPPPALAVHATMTTGTRVTIRRPLLSLHQSQKRELLRRGGESRLRHSTKCRPADNAAECVKPAHSNHL